MKYFNKPEGEYPILVKFDIIQQSIEALKLEPEEREECLKEFKRLKEEFFTGESTQAREDDVLRRALQLTFPVWSPKRER